MAAAGPQAIVTVLYNQPKDTAAFEQYYSETHLPLVSANQQEIGFTKAELTKFTSTLDGKQPPIYRQAEPYFDSMDAAMKGTATPGFKKVGDDLGNFATGGLAALIGEQE
ncbi:MAG TPA: EthD family reductase [Gemmatimonadales bacterium]|nr:EthD family reductase [Gemmatimonadales bacterium]